MSHDNRLWGTERIRGELLKLGIVVSKRSIRRYRWRRSTPAGSQTWRTFLTNQLKGIWAADLLVVQTGGFCVLYVFFFINHDRRELVHFNVTACPTAAWVWPQLIEATPWGRHPNYLIHDRDAVYGHDIDARLATLGVTGVKTPFRSPRANSIARGLCAQFGPRFWIM
ncbi:MAG: transposase [Candidatus Dormibacteria bacterium]